MDYNPNNPRVIRRLTEADPSFVWAPRLSEIEGVHAYVFRCEKPFMHFVAFNLPATIALLPRALHEIVDGTKPFRFFLDIEAEIDIQFDYEKYRAEKQEEAEWDAAFEAELNDMPTPEYIAPVEVTEAQFYADKVGSIVTKWAKLIIDSIPNMVVDYASLFYDKYNAVGYDMPTLSTFIGVDVEATENMRDIVILDASSIMPRQKIKGGEMIVAPPKVSFHVIFTNLFVANSGVGTELTKFLIDSFKEHDKAFAAAIDHAAIKKTFSLRAPGCSKIDEPRRMLRLYGCDPQPPTELLHLLIQRPAPNRFGEIGDITGVVIGANYQPPARIAAQEQIGQDRAAQVIRALMAKFPQYFEGYEFWCFNFSCFKFNRIGRTPPCQICEREHTHSNALYVLWSRGRFFLRCFRDVQKRGIELILEDAPAGINLEDLPHYLARMNVITSEYRGVRVIDQRYIDDTIGEAISCGERTILCRSTCGTGKTVGLEHAFESARKLGSNSICMISTRKAFTNEKAQQFGLETYLDYKDEAIPTTIGRFIIQYESLFRLNLREYYPAVLVLDEWESICEQITSNQMREGSDTRPIINLIALEELIKRADIIIVLDANLTTFSADYFRKTRGNICTILNVHKIQREVISYRNDMELTHAIFSALRSGQRIVVCSDMCSWLDKLEVELVKENILAKDEIRIITGATRPELDDELKKDNLTITDVARRYRLFAYNSALLAGVSIEDDGLTSVFTVCSKRFMSPVALFQMICRIRAMTTLHIYAEDENEFAETTFEEEASRSLLLGGVRPREFFDMYDRMTPLPRLLIHHRVNIHNSRMDMRGSILALWSDSGANVTFADVVRKKSVNGNAREVKQKRVEAIAAPRNEFFKSMHDSLIFDYHIHEQRREQLTPEIVEKLIKKEQRESFANLIKLNNCANWRELQRDDRAALVAEYDAIEHQARDALQERARERLRAIEIMERFGLDLDGRKIDGVEKTREEYEAIVAEYFQGPTKAATISMNKFLKRVFGAQVKSRGKIKKTRGRFALCMDNKLLTKCYENYYYIDLQLAPDEVIPSQNIIAAAEGRMRQANYQPPQENVPAEENIARVDPIDDVPL